MLDRETAERLWDEKIQSVLLATAHKYYWLDDLQDPMDLFQELAVDVWLPTVENFNMGKVTYTEDLDRAVNAFFQQRLTSKIQDLVKMYGRLNQRTNREMRRLDLPATPGSGGDEGISENLRDRLPSGEDLEQDSQIRMDFESMMAGIDPTLEDIIRFVISWDDFSGRLSQSNKALWNEVRERWGMDRKEVYRSLANEPDFVSYLQTNVKDDPEFLTKALRFR